MYNGGNFSVRMRRRSVGMCDDLPRDKRRLYWTVSVVSFSTDCVASPEDNPSQHCYWPIAINSSKLSPSITRLATGRLNSIAHQSTGCRPKTRLIQRYHGRWPNTHRGEGGEWIVDSTQERLLSRKLRWKRSCFSLCVRDGFQWKVSKVIKCRST